ncbi:hypothetical protein ACHAXS_006846 [Conticribra weissflogii]
MRRKIMSESSWCEERFIFCVKFLDNSLYFPCNCNDFNCNYPLSMHFIEKIWSSSNN